MEPNAIDLVIYLFGISIFILIVVLYMIWTDPHNDEVLVDTPDEDTKDKTKKIENAAVDLKK